MAESRALALTEQFRPFGQATALRMAKAAWRQLSVAERAAVAYDWSFWARYKQLPPSGDWKSWGFLTGRGFGKTAAISRFVNEEVEAGRAMQIGLAAQDEANCVTLQINGPSGLIAMAHPKRRPVFEAGAMRLRWPNGALAYVRTPEVPGKIRGLDLHLSWICELQSWPNSTREEAFTNFGFATRIGYGRTVWDATPKRRNPILKKLIANAEADPKHHVLVTGSLRENSANLSPGFVAEMVKQFGGTSKGEEEIDGRMLSDSELAIVRQAWIDSSRRNMPSHLVRRVISIDPAITDNKGSDTTGIIEAGLGVDGQEYVLGDYSGKHTHDAWATIVLDCYVNNHCDLVIAETNKGGTIVTQNLKVIAKERGLDVVTVLKEERPQRVAGKVFVKEVFARGAKEDRAEPVGTAYQRQRISHVIGVNLVSLEDTLTVWEPGARAISPGDLDALVHASVELLDLTNSAPNPSAGFQGIAEVAKAISTPVAPSSLAFTSLFGGSRADRI